MLLKEVQSTKSNQVFVLIDKSEGNSHSPPNISKHSIVPLI